MNSDILIAASYLPGVTKAQIFGRNAAISNAAETVWTTGGTYAQLTAAVALEAVSGSANDAAAGAGARTIEVDLIDGNYAASTVTVTMNGTTPVAITGTFLAVNGVRVITAGPGGTNAGVIDIRTVSGSVVKGAISATAGSVGKSADFIYTIPANTIGVLCPIRMSTYGATGALMAYLNTYTSAGVLRNIGGAALSLQGIGVEKGDFPLIDFGKGLRLEEKTLIELRVINSTGAGDLFAMADLFLFDRSLQKWVQ